MAAVCAKVEAANKVSITGVKTGGGGLGVRCPPWLCGPLLLPRTCFWGGSLLSFLCCSSKIPSKPFRCSRNTTAMGERLSVPPQAAPVPSRCLPFASCCFPVPLSPLLLSPNPLSFPPSPLLALILYRLHPSLCLGPRSLLPAPSQRLPVFLKPTQCLQLSPGPFPVPPQLQPFPSSHSLNVSIECKRVASLERATVDWAFELTKTNMQTL